MHVRTLRGVRVVGGRLFYDFHTKTYRQSFGRKTLRVVTGLVAQQAVHHVFSWRHGVQRMYGYRDGEISAVHVELLIRRKSEGQILSLWIANISQVDYGGQVHLQICWTKVLGVRH